MPLCVVYWPFINILCNIQQAIPIALSNIRDEKGYCPLRVRQFLLDLLRFNDNTGNVFSDNFYISNLVSALGHSLIPDLSRNMDLENEFEDESLRQEDMAGSDILEQAVREIDQIGRASCRERVL